MLGQNKRSQFDPVERILAIRKQAANRGPVAADLPGPAPNTAGPHRQDLLNKLDPTVDSMDGGTQILGSGMNPPSQRGMEAASTVTNKRTEPDTTTIYGRQNTTAIPRDQEHARHTFAIPRDQHHATPSTSNKETSSFGSSGAVTHRDGPGAGQVHKSRMANELDPRINTGPGETAIPGRSTGHEQPSYGSSGRAYDQEQPNAPSGVSHQPGHPFGPTGGARTREQSNMPVDTSQVSRRPIGSGEGAYTRQSSTALGGSHVSERRLRSTDRDYAQQATDPGPTTHGPRQSLAPYDEDDIDEQPNMPIGGSHRPERGVGSTGQAYTHQSHMPFHDSHSSERKADLADEYGPQDYTTAGGAAVPRGGNYTTPGARTTSIREGPEVHPGPASKTAGPHSNNWLNKLDPRVDSKATVVERREYRTS